MVKAAREERAMSQRALSKAVGLYPMSIMSFERGERELTVLELIDIAKALGVDPIELFRAAAEDGPLD